MKTQPTFTPYLDTLDNGLRLVTVELPHLHFASIVAYVRVGSRFESPRDNGLSHFLEHMLFRGTTRLPDAYQINHAVEEIGGTLYAETRRDCSLYQIGLHPETLEPGLQLLGEILREPTFSALSTERRIILEEMQEDLDQRGEDVNLSDLVYQLLFPGQALGQKITGPMANVERFDVGDVRRHLTTHYGARNLILCVAGAVQRSEVLPWAQRALRAQPAGQAHALAEPTILCDGPKRVHRDGDTGTQTNLMVAFPTAGERDPDFPALLVLSRILDDGMSTRLYQKVVNELGLAYYVSAGLDSFVDVGIFDVEATAVHASVPQLLKVILGLFRDLRDKPVGAAELQKVKRRYRWDLLTACDDPGTMADWWGRGELYHHPIDLAARLSRIEAITPEDVQRVAQRVFQPAQMVLGTVGRLNARLRRAVNETLDEWHAASHPTPSAPEPRAS